MPVTVEVNSFLGQIVLHFQALAALVKPLSVIAERRYPEMT